MTLPFYYNPYHFAIETPAQISFSGGRTSGFMLWAMLDHYNGKLPKDAVVSFQNTGKEREETLQFVHEVETRWGVPVVWLEWDSPEFDVSLYRGGSRLPNDVASNQFRVVNFESASRYGEPFMRMIDFYRRYREEIKDAPAYLPNPTARICTAQLKIEPSKRYMLKLYDHWNSYVGLRADEPSRVARMGRGDCHYDTSFPLHDADIVKRHIYEFWQTQPFDLQIESHNGNCDLCFLKTSPNLIRVMQQTNKFDSFWIEAERLTGQVFRRDRPSYSELRRLIQIEDPWIKKVLDNAAPEELVIDCFCGED